MEESLRELRGWERREVRRAVVRGRPLADRRLAAAARELAQEVEETASGWSWRSPSTWPSAVWAYLRTGLYGGRQWFQLVYGAFFFALSFAYHDNFMLAVAIASVVLFLFGAARYAVRAPRMAAKAERENRSLFEDR